MIVSREEISNVLGLTRPVTAAEAAASMSAPRPTGVDPADRPRYGYATSDRRSVRVRSLREMLESGGYELPADMLAEKMIGRALCDQLSRLYELN